MPLPGGKKLQAEEEDRTVEQRESVWFRCCSRCELIDANVWDI